MNQQIKQQLMNEEQAERMMLEICKWIGGEVSNEDVSRRVWKREPNIAALAREWSEMLLAAAMAEGLSGCPLCQG